MASCESCTTQRVHFFLIYSLVGLTEESISVLLYYMAIGANLGDIVAIGKLLQSILIGVFVPDILQVTLTIILSILLESRVYCYIDQE